MFKTQDKEAAATGVQCVYGTYKKSEDFTGDSYLFNEKQIFVSPDVTEVKKIQVLHFPDPDVVTINQFVQFIVKKNGAHGNIATKIVSPLSVPTDIYSEILDPDRVAISFMPKIEGVFKIHIRFNDVEVPSSPLRLLVEPEQHEHQSDEPATPPPPEVTSTPQSNFKLVKYHGSGLQQIYLNNINEFIIDALDGGNNILVVTVTDPNGRQCKDVQIKHFGQNLYKVSYRVPSAGQYVITVKWGRDHIPDSPFSLVAT